MLKLYKSAYYDYNSLKNMVIKIDKIQFGGANRPRFDAKINTMESVFDTEIRAIVINILTLEKLLKEPMTNKPQSEKIGLIEIYTRLKSAIDKANREFIRMMPMIFFVIEYPTYLYANLPGSHYNITYQYPEIVFTNENEEKKYLGYHQAFLQSKNNNTTDDLLHDDLIGLDSITKITSMPNAPKNFVSNIMFAIGASGTGKTTKYFGGEKFKTKDRIGIIPHIISKNINNKIDMAYFVCYGRQKKTNEDNTIAFDETLLFITNDNLFSYKMNNNDNDKNTNIYSEFYAELMMKKLCKIDNDKLKKYIKNEENIPNCDANSDGNFRNILITNKDIWMKVPNDTTSSDFVKNRFEELFAKQKKLTTVMPTINNFESSRGHTCILLRMTDNTDNVSYFPLFDMAGTEDINKINNFYDRGEANEKKMKSVVQQLVEQYIKKMNDLKNDTINIKDKKENGKEVKSLKDIEDQLIKKIDQVGGKDTPVVTIEELLENIVTKNNDTKLIDKIKDEGAYISHTISLIIFSMLCLGATQKAEVKDSGEDQFDLILNTVQTKMAESKLCTMAQYRQNQSNTCGTTMYLYNELINYNQILNNSCIWPQIIFSFLYWSEETKDSTKKYFQDYLKQNQTFEQTTSYLYQFDKTTNISDNNIEITIDNLIKDNFDKYDKINGFYKFIKDNNINISNENKNIVLGFPNNTYKKINNGNLIEFFPTSETLNNISKQTSAQTNLQGNDLNEFILKNIWYAMIDTMKPDTNIKSYTAKIISSFNFYNSFSRKIQLDDDKVKIFIEKYLYLLVAYLPYDDFKKILRNNITDQQIIQYKDYHEQLKKEQERLLQENNNLDFNKTLNKTIKSMLNTNNNSITTFVNDILTSAFNQKNTEEKDTQKQVRIQKEKDETNKKITQELNTFIKENADIINMIITMQSQNKIIDTEKLIKYKELSAKIKKYLKDKNDANKEYDTYIAQIERVKDASRDFFPPTSILMHCVTGQSDKKDMVETTLEMCQTLYNAVNVTKEKDSSARSTTTSGTQSTQSNNLPGSLTQNEKIEVGKDDVVGDEEDDNEDENENEIKVASGSNLTENKPELAKTHTPADALDALEAATK